MRVTDLREDAESGVGGAAPVGDGDDWEEGEGSLASTLEDAFDDPEGELENEGSWEEGDAE